MGFSSLRVINDDWLAPRSGFEQRGHQDMEIIPHLLDGHHGTPGHLGKKGVIGAGDVQLISAGSGIQHSEFNPSPPVSADGRGGSLMIHRDVTLHHLRLSAGRCGAVYEQLPCRLCQQPGTQPGRGGGLGLKRENLEITAGAMGLTALWFELDRLS